MRRPLCMLGLAFVTVLWLCLHFHPLPAAELEDIDRSDVILTGQVDKKEYHISDDQKILVLYLKEVQVVQPQTIPSEIKNIICYVKNDTESGREPRTGSYVRLHGKLYAFEGAANPGEFDARRYYRILDIQAKVQNAVIVEESASYDKFREGLYQIRIYLSFLLDNSFEKQDASIMKAILLGEKSGLDEETKRLYQLSGIIHILSISGLHISLIGMSLHKLLRKTGCPEIINVILSAALMYCYGIMTGMSISAYRALVMFGFHVAAGLFGRTYDMLTAMTIAAVSALACQPLYLYHSGFLFSFGAILAIGLFLPAAAENPLTGTKAEKMMSASLAVSIVTMPVYLCFYYEYPLYSLLLNVLIVPGMGLILSDGMLSLLAAMVYLPLGSYAALPARVLLALYEFCCHLTLSLPGSRNIPGRPENWQIVVFALLLCIAVRYSRKWSRLLFWQWILLALMCITMRYRSGLQITFLDVGQGDCIYLADENNNHYLIDGGSSSKSDVGTWQILPFLKEEGADTLDAVFVTHLDSDHYNGIRTLVEETAQSGIAIKNLILPDIGGNSRGEEYKELEALAVRQGITVLYIHRGEMLRRGSLRFTCLHPEKGAELESNEASVVLYLEYGAFCALFTGDLEGSGEEAVRRQLEDILPEGKGVAVLKVAHHGSKNSTKEAFLETASPRIALISAGKNNRYGHPHEELMARLERAGCHIYQTKEGGAVTVRVAKGGRSMRVETFLGE
ncbi:MAG: DNA internalization-related competence protein ComEC/Rec2 [Blautia sp.]|nr:DNA internalization-related competence protein ComEC/Rec2 [Blautia sp.]MCM1202198.1 DNA internalization-related competence protein ComEC/Rec2 [Bacteroides fragilis]